MVAYTSFAENTYQRGGFEQWVTQIIANLNRLESALELEQTQLWCLQPDPIPRVFCWNTLEGWEIPARIDAVRAAAGLAAFEWPLSFNLYDQSRFMSATDLNTLSRAVGYPATRQQIGALNYQNSTYLYYQPILDDPYYTGASIYTYKIGSNESRTLNSQSNQFLANAVDYDVYPDEADGDPLTYTYTAKELNAALTKAKAFFFKYKDTIAYSKTNVNYGLEQYQWINKNWLTLQTSKLVESGVMPDPETAAATIKGPLTWKTGYYGQNILQSGVLAAIPPTVANALQGDNLAPISFLPGAVGGIENIAGGMFFPYAWAVDSNVLNVAYEPQMGVFTSATLVKAKTWRIQADAIMETTVPLKYSVSALGDSSAAAPALYGKIIRTDIGESYQISLGDSEGAKGFVRDYDSAFSSALFGFYIDPAWSAQPLFNNQLPFNQAGGYTPDREIVDPGTPPFYIPKVRYNEVNLGQGYQRDIAYAELDCDIPVVWLAARR